MQTRFNTCLTCRFNLSLLVTPILFLSLVLPFSVGAETLLGATDQTVTGTNDAAGAMWNMSRGPLLGVIALLVFVGVLVGAALAGRGGAVAGGFAALVLAAFVVYAPRIVNTLYTVSGANAAGIRSLGSGLAIYLPFSPMTALISYLGIRRWRNKR